MVAVLSTDAVLSRMLTLAVRQCGFSVVEAAAAEILLLDLDHPAAEEPLLDRCLIGFSAKTVQENNEPKPLFARLSLPFFASELQDTLFRALRALPPRAELQYKKGTILIDGRCIAVGGYEERLFSLLYARRGEVVTTAELRALLSADASSNLLQVYLYRLRRKLSYDGVVRIAAVRGVGYCLRC